MHGHKNTYRLTNNCRGGGVHTIALRILAFLILFFATGFANLQAQITLTQSASTSCSNINIVFTATISPDPVTGSIDFYDGSTYIGSATLNAGKAVFYKNNLSPGSHVITAKYLLIESNPVTHTVNPAINPGTIDVTGGERCPDGNPGTISSLTPATGGNEGLVYTWQTSIDNGITWNNTGITTESYNPDRITQTTQYRRMVYDGCGTMAYTAASQYTVYPEAVSQTINASPNLIYNCSGTDGITCTGSICAGVAVSATFSGGTSGIPGRTDYDDIYEVSINGGTWTSYTPGSIISTSNFLTAGTVSIRTRRQPHYTTLGCNYGKYNIVTWTVNPIPTLSSTLTSARTSNSSVDYVPQSNVVNTNFTWMRDAVPGISNPASSGTGSITETLLNTTKTAIDVTYHYTLNAGGCTNTQDIILSISANPPTAYNVTGGGSYCAGGAGVAVGLDNSENGASYQLVRDGGNVGSPIPGTGSAISFGNQTVAGTYTIVGTDGGGSTTMNGSTTITVNAIPSVTAGNGGAVCAGSTLNLTASNVAGATYAWTGPDGFTSTQQNPSIANATTAASGVYSVTVTVNGCTSPASTTTATVNAIPSVTAGNGGAVCAGSTLNLTASNVAGATYAWTGPDGFTSTQQNPSIANATTAASGVYSVTVTVNGCTSPASTTTATVNAIPSVTAGNGGAVCAGSTLNLTASNVAGATYAWTGPDGFTSTQQNPSIANATTAASGVYSVTVTVNGCTSPASTTTATVNAIPSVTAGNGGAVCAGSTLNLTASNVAGATYAWTGPDGFTSTQQNPSIANATTAASGVYSVTVTVNGCTSPASTTTATVNAIPSVTAGNGGAVCAGSTLNLTASNVAGATYAWTGPDGFTSTQQNPSIANATTAASGVYSVTVTVNGCTSPASTTTATVNAILPVSVTIVSDDADNVICNGQSITFTATPTNGGTSPTYQWRVNGLNVPGANGSTFTTSTLANGSVVQVVLTSNATPCATGSPATSNGIPVTVNPVPTAPTAGNGGTACVGGTISLTASNIAGATYSWTGPNGFTSNVQSPTISGATAAMAGTYSVTATLNGCTSTAATTPVTVNPIPPTPTANSNSPVCAGTTINLSTPAVAGATYSWTGPNGYTSNAQNPTISNATAAMAGTYNVTIIVNGCPSAAGSTSVVINAAPTAPSAGSNSPVCAGGTINLTASNIAGATYSWTGPNGFTSNVQSPTISGATAAMAGTYSVTATVNGCPSSAATTNVIVNNIPSAPSAGSNSPVCAGGTINLTASNIAGATYSWTGPNGFTSNVQSPTISGATAAMAGTYSVTATVNGCTSAAATTPVTVNPVPSAPSAGNGGAACVGGTISLTASNIAGATYSWTGPNSFTSNIQNPTIANATAAMAGTYSVTATVNGCTSAAATTPITVNPIPATPTANSNSPVCAGTTINLSTPAVAGATYSWTGPNGYTSNAQNPTIANATAAMAGTYNVTVTVNGCPSTAGSTSVVVNATVTPSVSITSTSNSICSNNGTPVTFTANPTNGGASPTYQWRRNGTNIPGATGSTYTTNSLANPSTITVVMTSNATCASPVTVTSNSIAMLVYTSAPTTGNGNNANAKPSGPTSICPPASGLVYNIPASMSTDAQTYTWNLPPGFVITSGAGTSQITVSVSGAGALNQNNQPLSVTATNPCGSVTSTSMLVNVGSFAAVNAGPDFSICLGNTATLTNVLSGNASSVSWALTSGSGTINGGPYPTAFTFTPAATGSVTLTATTNTTSGSCPSSVGTDQVIITVNQPPAITAQPVASQTLCSGSAASFSVTATGTGLTYQWQKNGSNISGATSSTYNIASVSAADAGNYAVIVSGASPCTPVTSTTAALVVNQAPAISVQPVASQTLCSGSTANFSVTASGTGLSYQWQKGGVNIPGATSASYSIPNVTTADAGTYTVVVSGTAPCASTTSQNAVLNVNQVVAITAQPTASQTLCSGSAASFSVTATGTGLTYQWQKNGSNISGATSSTYNIASVSAADAGNYAVIVSGASPCTPVTSTTAALVVNQAPAISVQPVASQTLCSGSTANFSVTASGTGLSYQWQKGGVNIPGATSASYSIPNVTTADAGTYTVVVSGTAPCASTTSQNAVLNVNQVVAITAQPTASQTLCSGSAASFSVTATGTGLTYQWQKNGSNIAGATSSTYNIASVSAADAGNYAVIVSGASPCTPVTSTTGALVVNQPVVITSQPAASQTVCSGFPINFSVTATGTGITYQWQKGGVNIPGANSASYSIPNASTSDAGTYTVVVSGIAPCPPVTSQNSVLTVNQDIDITAQPVASQTLCTGTTATISVTATGNITDYVWRKNGIPVSNGGTISGATTATLTISGLTQADAGSYDVVISGPGGVCGQTISNPSVLNVNQNSTISLSSAAGTDAQTKCISTALTPITYAIGGGGTGASITAGALPAGVTGTYSNGVFTISGTPTAAGPFNYTITTTGPCTNVSTTGTITVNQNSTISISSAAGTDAQTKCISTALTPITYAIGGGGTGASITAGALPAGVTGTYSNGVFTISGTPTAAGPFNYTITTTGPCTNVSTTGTITVNQNSTISLSSAAGTDAQTKCISTALTPIAYAIGGGGTGASITAGALPAGVTGTYSNGVFTISGTPTAAGPFNYTITTTGPCNNVSASGTITVNDNSILTLTSGNATQPVCAGGSISPITYNVGGGATGVTISGLPTGVSGTLNNGVYTISGNPTVPGTYPFSITTTGPCVNPVLNGTITVNPNSTLTLTSPSANQTLCINSVPTNIIYTVGGGATGATVTGLPPGMAGSYNNGTFTISNTPTAAGTYNYTVTTTGNCNNVSLGGTITVNPAPVGGTTSPAITTICGTTNSGTISLTGQSGTIIRWESSTNGGGTWSPISNTTSTFSYSNLAQTTIFRAVIQSGVCPLAYSTNAVVSMVPATTPTATVSPTQVCLGQSANLGATSNLPQSWADIDATFNQANPAGWRITQNGVEINFPANADNASTFPWSETNGPKTPFNGGVTYNNLQTTGKFAIASGQVNTTMETPVFSTIGMTSATLQFYQALVFAAGASGKIEISTDGGATYNNTLVQYTGPLNIGNPLNSWDPLSLNLSNYLGLSNLRIRFTYTGANNSNWAIDGLNLQPPGPIINYNWTLTNPTGVPSPYYLDATNQQNVVATPPAPGTYTYQVATTIGGCPGGTASVVVNVKPLPTCDISGPNTVCPGSSSVFSGPATSGYTYQWSISGGGTISGSTTSQNVTVIANNSCGSYTLRLITTVNGCSSTPCTYTVNVVDTQKPVVTGQTTIPNLGCNPPTPTNAFVTPSVTDNCPAPVSLKTGYPITSTVSTVNCSNSQTRTWIYVDVCGNESLPFVQTISWTSDIVKPVITLANAGAVNCNATPADVAAAFGAATVIDNCSSGLTATGTIAPEVVNGCQVSVTKNWTVTDACGNTGTASQTITFTRDNTAPTVSGQATVTGTQCNVQPPFVDPTPADNCGTPTLKAGYPVLGTATPGANCTTSQTKTWIYVDACGNESLPFVQTATWKTDNTPPTVTGQATVTGTQCNVQPAFVDPTPADNCTGTITIKSGYPIIGALTPGANCTTSQTKTWIYVDACGNESLPFVQTATWNTDTEKPTVTGQATVTGTQCNEQPPFVDPTPADNCGTPTLKSGYPQDGTITPGANCTSSQTRTWVYVDACGNESVPFVQTATWKTDIMPPTLTCPTVPPVCEVANKTYTIPPLTVTDNCSANGALTITYTITGATSRNGTGVDASGIFEVGVSTITWTVVDECGNSNTCTTQVTINPKPTPIIYHN